MKRFNIYSNGTLYITKSEEEMFYSLSKKIEKNVKKLKIGESCNYTNKAKREWEIERIV